MSDFRKKLPIELDHLFMSYISHRYSKEARLFIVPQKYPGANKIVEKETYWLSEKYAVVQNDYIAYRDDYICREDFDWKPASDMSKDQARYGIECIKIEKKKLKSLNKSELIKSGIAPETFPSNEDEGITTDFQKRPKEFWRFRKRWEREFEEYVEWDDQTEIFIFHFEIHRFKPKLTIYNWHVEDKLRFIEKEIEFKIRLEKQLEKEAEDEKNNRKKTKPEKNKNKKTSKKKINKKTRKKK